MCVNDLKLCVCTSPKTDSHTKMLVELFLPVFVNLAPNMPGVL